MKGYIAFLACILVLTSAASIKERKKRQTERINLTQCFEEWKRDTSRWIDSVRDLTTSLLNSFVNDDDRQRAMTQADDELKKQFDAVFDPRVLQVTEYQCQRQLDATKETLHRAIEKQWKELEESINKALEDSQNASQTFTEGLFSAWQSFTNWLATITGQTIDNNNNND